MGSTIGRFTYELTGVDSAAEPGQPDIPMPMIQICLKRWTAGEDGTPFVTPILMTEGEIDANVAMLKADLEAVGQEAKVALRNALTRSGISN
jgi:hypothetical protein